MKILETLLIASVSFSLFYVIYLVLSKKQRSFDALRFYLISTLIISVILPFLHLEMLSPTRFQSFQKESNPQVMVLNADVIQTPESVAQQQTPLLNKQDFYNITVAIYLLITGFFLFRLMSRLISMMVIIARSKTVEHNRLKIICNSRFKNTFSFFKWVFVHHDHADLKELAPVISHEKVHVRQFHSLDLILAELFLSLQWFNPFSWMMLQSLQLLHEYQADEVTLQTGIKKTDYQALLINQIAEEKLVGLSSSFNQSLIKKRIIMMTQRDQETRKHSKMLFTIPATLMVIVVAAILQSFLVITEPVHATDGAHKENNTVGYNNNDHFNNNIDESMVTDSLRKKTVHVEIIESESSSDTIKKRVYRINELESETVIVEADGNVTVSGTNFTTNQIDSLKNKEVVEVRVMGKESYEWTETDGKTTVHTTVINSKDKTPQNLLYIIDGIESESEEALLDIEPGEIDKVEVYKGEKVKEYTDKQVEGVIVITRKKP